MGTDNFNTLLYHGFVRICHSWKLPGKYLAKEYPLDSAISAAFKALTPR